MAEEEKDFFEGKRLWSKIKDQVLKDYMPPYLAKVNALGKPILLIDGYAGPGIFGDNSVGSPIIMCEAAEKYAHGNYQAIFINNEKKYHEQISQEIQKRGWSDSVQTILGNSQILLKTLPQTLKDQTVFLYLDPFGPTGCAFSLLEPFLRRNPAYSTEILLTLSMPAMHRLATPKAVQAGRQNEQLIQEFHRTLTVVLGGNYWKDILWKEDADAETKEQQLIQAYLKKLQQYLPYTGSCPVRERTNRRIKYYIVFASRHPDALKLLNDIMTKAYFAKLHTADFSGGLWEETDWREMRIVQGLDHIILGTVKKYPGMSRKDIWVRIIQDHFMRFLEPEYRDTIQRLVKEGRLRFVNPRGTNRLNDNCKFYPPS